MKRIFKYDFGRLSPGLKTITIDNSIYRILDIQEQGYHLVMWVSVWDDIKPQDFTIDVRLTGDTEPNKIYFKTIQSMDGLVYHIYI
jgi:hypothetical protein